MAPEQKISNDRATNPRTANPSIANSEPVRPYLQKALETLADRSFSAEIVGATAIQVKVGINIDAFCSYLSSRGIAVTNSGAGIALLHFPSAESPTRAVETNDAESTAESTAVFQVASKTAIEEVIEAISKALETIEHFCASYLIGFDLDGTLVDTTESFDTTVKQLVLRHSGQPLTDEELKNLRAEGGFNNNWDAAVELIRRRGKVLTRKHLDPEALEIYFSLAEQTEKLIVSPATLKALAKRHPLFILTGRCQFEYKPVWADRLSRYFEKIYCLDDLPHCKPKPAADSLTEILQLHKASAGVYIGNALDDMWAARAAGMNAIAVTTTHSAGVLEDAGAQFTCPLPDGVLEAFLL
jgi:phosphoglycolate phosphatase-like HAD superfamily hydrolase